MGDRSAAKANGDGNWYLEVGCRCSQKLNYVRLALGWLVEGQEPFKSGGVATHAHQHKTFGKTVYCGNWEAREVTGERAELGSWCPHRGLKGFRQQVVRP